MDSETMSALKVWREKLEFLLTQEASATAPDQKFEIKKQIEEARQKINELESAGDVE